MKKLMVAAAIVCAAVMSHGAACSWNIASSGALANPSGVVLKNISNPTMYIYMSTATAANLNTERKNLLAALKSNDTPTGYATSFDLASGSLGLKTYDSDSTVGTSYSFYGVIIGEDAAGNKYAFFTGNNSNGAALKDNGGSGITLALGSTSLRPLASTSAATAGWYQISAGAVPEPTSGLLLLLGVGALALRRRRA